MSNVCYFLVSTEKNASRKEKLSNTWLKGKSYYFFSDKENKKNNTLKMSDRDDYPSGEEKFINGLNYVLENKEKFQKYDWFVFCDDDTFISEKNLFKNTHLLDKNMFNGKILSLEKDPYNPIFNKYNFEYLSGGAGMVISPNCFYNLEKLTNFNTTWGDVSLGLSLQKQNFKINHIDLFNSCNYNDFSKSVEEIKDQISFHYIKDENDVDFLLELDKSEV